MKRQVAALMFCMLCLVGCASGAGSSSHDRSATDNPTAPVVQDSSLVGVWTANVEDNGEAFVFTLDLSEEGTWSMTQSNTGSATEVIGSGTYAAQDDAVNFLNSAGKQEFRLKLSTDGAILFEQSEDESDAFVRQ